MSHPRFLARLNTAFMVVAAFWALALAANIAADVIGRAAFNRPILGTTEIITNSVVMIAFLQLPYAIFSRSMLRADFLLHLLPAPLARLLAITGMALGAALFGLLAYGVIDPMHTAWVRGEFEGEGSFRLPTWPIYAVILVGAALAALNYLLALWAVITGQEDA